MSLHITPAVIWGLIAGAISGALTALIVFSTHPPDATDQELRLQIIEQKLDNIEASTLAGPSHSKIIATTQSKLSDRPAEQNSVQIDSELASLSNRLAAVESAVAVLEAHKPELPVSNAGFRATVSSKPVQTYGQYKTNDHGENAFREDVGPGLGVSEEMIFDIFSDMGSEVIPQEIYCKASICKITLSGESSRFQAGSDGGLDPADTFLFELSELYDVGDIDVDYAKDEQGNRVMYIRRHINTGTN